MIHCNSQDRRRGEVKLRDEIITAHGIRVIRFSNEEVISHCERVEQRIKEAAGMA